MSSTNVIVTKTTNKVTFEVDKGSYNAAKKKIQSMGKEWNKAQQSMSAPKNSPAKAYSQSAEAMRKVNKRLADTRMKEERRATDHSIAMAKKEARAKEAIARSSSARIKQHMGSMTAKNPNAAAMRKFYQQQERAAKKAGRTSAPASPARSGPLGIRKIHALQVGPRGGFGTGMVGNPKTVYDPSLQARQNAQMMRSYRQESQAKVRRDKASIQEKNSNATRSARINDTISQQQIRLSSKYGSGYGSTLGKNGAGQGIYDLNNQFKAGVLSSGQYRQSIQALERQFRTAQGSAATFGGALEQVRGSIIGATTAYGAFAAGKSIMQQGQFFQGLDATMLMVSDSSEEAGKRLQFVKDQSYRLGLSLKEASNGYVQMSIAADGVISKQENDDLFKGFSEYATALQVDPVRYQRGITAIQQMMGKGQIMAEELKQQLAEGIPGSLQVFVKATREAFNDSSVDVEKLMDMMSKGELKAAKVMPFVAKYYAEAARKGGALNKALDGNRVAMERMIMTFKNFQDQIFESKFGDQLTKIFRDLATMLSSNGDLAKNIGTFFGSMMEGAWDAVLTIHDAFVLLDRILEYYVEKMGIQGDTMKQIFDWGGYILGMGLFISGLSKILGILTSIVGLRGGLGAITKMLGGDLATAAGVGAITTGGSGGHPGMGAPKGGGTPGPKGWGSTAVKGGGFAAMLRGGLTMNPYLAAAMFAGGAYATSPEGAAQDAAINKGMDPLRSTQSGVQQAVGGDGMLFGALLWNSLFGKSAPSPNVSVPGVNPTQLTTTFPYPANQGPPAPPAKITVEIKAGDLKNMIKGVVDEQGMFNINMLTSGSGGG